MKKIFTSASVMLIACATLASCDNGNKSEVDIQYQLTVSVDARNVVKDLKDIYSADYFPNGQLDIDDYYVRINLFIYDEDGSLVEEETQIIDNFWQKLEIKKSMNTGEYTLVATADIVKIKGEQLDLEFWRFENTKDLRTLRATEQGYVGLFYKAIGVTKEVVEIKKAQSVNINVQPIGALITFYFTKLDASKMAILAFEWSNDADYYLIDDEEAKIDQATTISDEYEIEQQYTGYYSSLYFLPAEIDFAWGTFTAAEKLIKYGSTTFNVRRGVNQILTIDVQAGSSQLKSDTRQDNHPPQAIRIGQQDPAAPRQSVRIFDLP
jgi:hypothetical protein